MSDALRTVSSACRFTLGRFRLPGSRRCPPERQPSARGLGGRLFRKYVLLLVGLLSLLLLVDAGLHFWFSDNENKTAALLALTLGLAVLAALFLARRMVVPIRLLQAGAARIGAGELDRRIDIHTGDELEELAEEFNRMAGDLQKSHADLEKKVEDRTSELKEALDQQTATAEILQVINGSPSDLGPIFEAIANNSARLCNALNSSVYRFDGELIHFVAESNFSPRAIATTRRLFPAPPSRDNATARAVADCAVVHIPDVLQDSDYRSQEWANAIGLRSVLSVPMLREGRPIGVITVNRAEAGPFPQTQVELLKTFADQAVIAIENTRLITETREALEQQTATAEVLRVINSSPVDLAPVFNTILEKAHGLCGVEYGSLQLYNGELFRAAAVQGLPKALAERLRQGYTPGPNMPNRALLDGAPFTHTPDLAEIDDPMARATVELSGIRTILWIALRKDDALLGQIAAARLEVRPFSDKEIALLQNFAAQAVIAIENARLIAETREALEQQTATAEVLQVINSSPGDLAPVFEAMLEKAMRLCDASMGVFTRFDDNRFKPAVSRGVPPRYAEYLATTLDQPSPDGTNQRVLRGENVAHVTDLTEAVGYRSGHAWVRALVELGNARSLVTVALRKGDALLGTITLYRQEVRSFSKKEIALLQNFAAQAVIAMENARLITETREALDQQTATAEVLQVINSSPGDLTPVFDAILEKAHALCGVRYGSLELYDGERFRAVAVHGLSKAFADMLRQGYPASDNPATRPLIEGSRFTHIADLAETDYSITQSAVELASARTLLCVPLRRDNALLGMIACARHEVRPFSEKEIALLENFAAQAVIAMENVRLITELLQRTRDLQESLEYQTATSDVLKVISRSTFDLEPVLEEMVVTAARLCRAEKAIIYRRERDEFRYAVGFGLAPEYEQVERATPIAADEGTVVGRTALAGRSVQIADAWTDPLYVKNDDARLGNVRSMIGVPLMREGALVGVIALARAAVEPFTDRQIELITTFADQAVIAIENARLFDELRARTAELGRSVEELKMLSEVGQAVSSTLDLRSVLSTVLNASLGVTWTNAGAIFRYSRAERAFRLVEAVGWDEPLLRSVRDLRVAETETAMGEAAARRMPIQLAELAQRPSAPLRDASLAAGFHSALIAPLVGPERVLGAIILMRREAGEFPAETVRLMQTLASQSVLAIQNARLFREIADKSEQLALASQHKSQFLANMSHELRTPLNAILGYAELLVDGIYGVLPDRPRGVLERIQNNGKHLLALINDVLDLAKIEAGQLTLTIEDYSLPEAVKSVVTATEPLAASKGLKFTAQVQHDMPMAHGDARRVSQVLLNLVGNAIKFTDAGEVEIRAMAEKGQFILTVRDTGPGIADADQERIFGEFQQIDNSNTRKKGGTGLGLAISKRMVEMQGGTISVESALGQGSTFRVVLPVHVDEMMEAA